MGKIKPLPPKKIIVKLKRIGFVELHQRGSHLTLKNELTCRYVVVPMHSKDVPTGTLHNIVIKQAGLSAEEFNEL